MFFELFCLGRLCNDGTPAVYWFRSGADPMKSRWVIQAEGGVCCTTLQVVASPLQNVNSPNCTPPMLQECQARQRNNPYFTSSRNMPAAPTQATGGIVDPSQAANPDFYAANWVSMHYCSSDGWVGTGARGALQRVLVGHFCLMQRRRFNSMAGRSCKPYSRI